MESLRHSHIDEHIPRCSLSNDCNRSTTPDCFLVQTVTIQGLEFLGPVRLPTGYPSTVSCFRSTCHISVSSEGSYLELPIHTPTTLTTFTTSPTLTILQELLPTKQKGNQSFSSFFNLFVIWSSPSQSSTPRFSRPRPVADLGLLSTMSRVGFIGKPG